MITYALDTNIISFLLKEDESIINRIGMESKQGHLIVIPPIAYYEIKRGLLSITAPKKTEIFERLCNTLGIGELDTNSLDLSASIYSELKKKGKLVEDADILMAGFCIANGYILITNNTKHFAEIENLKIDDWSNNTKQT